MGSEHGAGAPGPLDRLVDVAAFGRLIVAVVGLMLAAFEPFGSLQDRPLAIALLGAFFLPYSIVTTLARRRLVHLWPVTAFVDLAAGALFNLIVPAASIPVLFGYIFVSVYYATVAGLMATIGCTITATILVQVARALGSFEPALDQYTLVIHAALMMMAGLMIEAATREQRQVVLREADRRFASIAHDIRLPLTAIDGFAGALLEQWPNLTDPLRTQMLVRLSNNVAELDQMVQDLLEFSNVTSDRIELHPQPIQLSRFLAMFVERHSPALGTDRVWLSIPANTYVEADPTSVERILGNLLWNAAQYSPRDATIRIMAEAAGDRVIVHIENEAPGISPQDFDIFFGRIAPRRRAGESRHGGLGIAIARAYASLHGGELKFGQTPDGVRASFSLPALASRRESDDEALLA